MGVYLGNVSSEDWFGRGEGQRGEVAAALNEELRRRGAAPYESIPGDADSGGGAGQSFEEKLAPSMEGFAALYRVHLSPAQVQTLLGWTALVPLSLDEVIHLPIESDDDDETVIAGAPQVLAIAERLATAIGLPPEVPANCGDLDLTVWFLDGAAERLAAARPGPWSDDLDAAFYVALYLRAAQHSLRHGCPLAYF